MEDRFSWSAVQWPEKATLFFSFLPFFLSRRGRAGEQKGSIGEAGPLIFSPWFGARARTRDKAVSPLTGASSNYGLASRQKQPVHVYTQKRSFSCVRSGETRERERRKKGTDDRGWLKWINDRRTREKYAVETEGLDIVTSTFSR